VSLVSGDATAHEDPVLSVDVDAVYALHAVAASRAVRPGLAGSGVTYRPGH
jgi:hypothetical protein